MNEHIGGKHSSGHCCCQIDIEIDGDWRRLLEDMQGFHWMICYGDYLREVGYALKKVGIKWQNITTAAKITNPRPEP